MRIASLQRLIPAIKQCCKDGSIRFKPRRAVTAITEWLIAGRPAATEEGVITLPGVAPGGGTDAEVADEPQRAEFQCVDAQTPGMSSPAPSI